MLPRLADYTNDVVLISEAEPIDGSGPRVVYVNAAFTRMTGYQPDEILGLTPRILQGPKTSPVVRAQIRAALRTWQPVRVDLLNYHKDGSEFWVELNITPVPDPTGWYRYWVSVQREASQLRRFDEQRRLYELILANIYDGLLVVDALDPLSPIEFVNAGFLHMTGFEREELLGRSLGQLHGRETDPASVAKLTQAVADGEPTTVEVLTYRKDGSSFWNLTSVVPLRDEQGRAVKVVILQRDLTNQKQREREMVAAQRLAAVGEMTGGIAHDFNNLLTAIGGSAELLSQRVAGDPELAQLVQTHPRRHAPRHEPCPAPARVFQDAAARPRQGRSARGAAAAQ